MQIAYAGVSPDQQSLPWAPGMGGAAAPVGTLAGAPAVGLDFLAALLAQAAMPEAKAFAPIHHNARAPVVGLAQALASTDASCPSLSFAGSGDAVRAAPAPPDRIVLDPPPAARVDEKRALLAGALAILPAPWALPVLPAPLSAVPASEAATPQVEVSAREKLLALIAMAQGAAPSAMLPAGPGGNRFAQTNPLIQPTFAATPDLERGQIVAPRPSGLSEAQVLSPAEPSVAAALPSPAATRPLSSAPSLSSDASGTPAAPTTAQEAPPVLEMSRPATVTAVMAAPAAKDAEAAKSAATAASVATASAATATLWPSQPALQEAPANGLVNPSARQSAALPDLPSGERVILEAAPMRPQPMASDAGLEQVDHTPRPFLEYAAAPAGTTAVTMEELSARALSQAPGPASEARLEVDGRLRAFSQSDPIVAVPMPAGTAADASPTHADRMPSADLRSGGAQATYPDATLVVPAPRQDAPTVPPSVAAIPPTTYRLSEGERSLVGPAFAAPATQGMRSDAVDPVVFRLASPGADFVAPAVAATVDAPASSSPAGPERLVKVEPAPDSVEQPLRPSESSMTNRAMAAAPTMSEPQPVAIDPAPVGVEQSLRLSLPTMGHAAAVAPKTSEPQPVAIDPAPVGVEQSLRPSLPTMGHAAAVAPTTSEPQSTKIDPAPTSVEQSLRLSSPALSHVAEVAPTTSEPQPTRVKPASVNVEQSLRPSASPTMNHAAEMTPTTSEPQPVRIDPTPISAGQPPLSSWMNLKPGQMPEVMATPNSLRSDALAAARVDTTVPHEPRRAGESGQVAGTPESSRWATGSTLAPDITRPAADILVAAPTDSTLMGEMTSPGFAATMASGPHANGEAQPDPTPVVRERALPDGRIPYGPIDAERPGRFEPTFAVAADGSVRKEEQPLPGAASPLHQPTMEGAAASVAHRTPVHAALRLAWEAYVSASGEALAAARTAAPVTTATSAPQTVAAPSVAQRSLAGPQEENRPSDPALATLPVVDRQPGSSPAADRRPDPATAASPALPISAPSAMRPDLTASWRPASGAMPSATREEHESSALRRVSGQSASASVHLETPMQPHVADLASASAPAVNRISSRPPAQPADGPAPHEASAQPPVAGVVSVSAPREGPSIVAEAAADPALQAEASEGFQELLDRIQIAVRRGESTWKLQLRPPSLGRLEVHLTAGAKGLEIVMRTETAEAQAFLQANLPELSRGLDQRGVVVERCEVSCGQSGADLLGASGEGRQQAGAAWQFAQPSISLPAPPARRHTAPTTSSAGAHNRSLVDLQA